MGALLAGYPSPADIYLNGILAREAVDNGPLSPVRLVQQTLQPILSHWGNGHLRMVRPSGSFAKGTANRRGTDIDLFLSVSSDVPNSLEEIQSTLSNALIAAGYAPRQQNVSLGIRVGLYDVDLVPARLQPQGDENHSLYLSKKRSWTKTNVEQHIALVRATGFAGEMRLIKLWRDRHQLEFPSFYLELAVWRALSGAIPGNLATNMYYCFRYLAADFANARFLDPANLSNVISDDLSETQKLSIAVRARVALTTQWHQLF